MEVLISQVDEITVATLYGELDGRTSAEVQEKLHATTRSGIRLLLDLQGVSYISSAGLRALLMIYRQITNDQGNVVLVGLSESLRDMMAITGFLEFFTACDTFDEGLQVLRTEQSSELPKAKQDN
jgi:anti-sigma B factor antagonist